jgi:REP element-mobilizing transposase RayT
MKILKPHNYISFFSATILKWNTILLNDKYKDIIVDSMRFIVKDNRIDIYAFVIMPNHIHIVWKVKENHLLKNVQRDFLKYTAQQIIFDLKSNNQAELDKYFVDAKDRKYQIWERNSLSSRLGSNEIVIQKINYIHANPFRKNWKLVENVLEYKYSSARFYYEGNDDFGFLTHYAEASY